MSREAEINELVLSEMRRELGLNTYRLPRMSAPELTIPTPSATLLNFFPSLKTSLTTSMTLPNVLAKLAPLSSSLI